MIMERKVGEIFEYNGEWYQCLEGTGCYKCAFYDKNICIANNPHCTCRSDKKNVIFKKLEKVGEPMKIHDRLVLKVKTDAYKCMRCCFYSKGTCELTMEECAYYDCGEEIKFVEIKQNKENMEEKKIKLSQDDIDWLKKQIRWAALPGYITDEEDYDRATEEIMNLFIPSDTEHPSSEKIGKNLKPFDLEAAKAGKPVCTRDGRKARIISFDLNNKNFPIVAIINCDTEENAYQYDIDGVCDEHDNNLNLMMSPEKKEGWVNVYKSYNVGKKIPCMASIYPTKEEAKKSSVVGFDYVDTVKIEWEE